MDWRKHIIPSPLELYVFSMASVLLLVLGSVGQVARNVLYYSGGEEFYVSASRAISSFWAYINSLSFNASLAMIVFWSIVGLFVYSLGWTLINTAKEINQDVDTATRYVHPSTFLQLQFWGSVIGDFAARSMAILVMILWTLLCAFVILPIAFKAFQIFVSDSFQLSNIGYALLGFLLALICITIYSFLLKIFVYYAK